MQDDFESNFSLKGIPGFEEGEKITATLADFPVNNWDSNNDVQHIVDWYNDLADKRGIERLSFREFMNMTGHSHFDSNWYMIAQDFLGFALMMLNEEEADREAHGSQTQLGEGTWTGLAIFWIITLVVCTASVFAGVWIVGAITADLGTSEWTPVKGVITESGVDTSQSDEGSNTYCLWVEYDYTIENRTYGGSTLSYSKEGNCDSWSYNADDEYPPGKNVTVYVNPDNHDEAVLLSGWSGIDFFMFCFLIFPMVGILLFGLCCKATYNSFMYPEKYIVGSIVPNGSSDSERDVRIQDEERHEWENDRHNIEETTIQIWEMKIPLSALKTIGILLVINVFFFAMFLGENEYANEFNIATESMEGTSEWPSTIAVFSDNFTIWYDDDTGGDYFSGSIIIYCTQSAKTWECGDNESGYERLEIPYQCIENESVGPLQNPCDWAMKMFVIDSYHDSDSHSLERWVVYVESEHCEWEGEPDDDNLWSCYYYNGETTEYDTWWQYCEHHLNESHWYCTDEFGEEASSPDNQNGTLYQPQEIETTVNYDPDDPTRIAFVEGMEWNLETTSPLLYIIPFAIIINLIILGVRGVMPIVRMNRNIRG